MSDTLLILHVKGTTDETRSLPKDEVRAAIAKGQISRSQLIWSPSENAWKQVGELPHLWPSQKLAPAPSANRPDTAVVPKPRVAIPATGGLPRPRVKVSDESDVPQPVVAVQSEHKDYVVEEKAHFNPLKWVCIILAILILGTLGFNYLTIEQPLVSALHETAYSKVMVYAHLGGFLQKDAIEIHVLGSGSIAKADVLPFFIALAHSTPQSTAVFERVSLTTGFFGEYTLAGSDWKEFGDMGDSDAETQKKFLLDHLTDATGQPLVLVTSNMTSDAQDAAHEKAWTAFTADFAGAQ